MASPVVSLSTLYSDVAAAYAQRIDDMFASEETLKEAWEKHLPGLTFDRTDRWNVILLRELEQVWMVHGPVVKSSLTTVDRLQVLHYLVDKLDYNLFTQVMLNLQNWAYLRYRVEDATADALALEKKWARKSPSPFDAGAKMFKIAATAQEADFDSDLSVLLAMRAIPNIAGFNSFRVSPKGSTPAFADACNLSNLGIGSDRYLMVVPPKQVYYFTWEDAGNIAILQEDGSFWAPDIPYPFRSRTGGEMLQTVLASRLIATTVFRSIDRYRFRVIMPRMNSVLVITDQPQVSLEEVCEQVTVPHIDFHVGVR